MAEGDHRELIRGRQEDFPIPPAALVMVSTPSRFGIPDANASMMMGAVDAGIVSQNIMLFCAANGLVTVPRASMNSAAIATLLKLPEGALPLITNPVGYPAKNPAFLFVDKLLITCLNVIDKMSAGHL